MPVGLGRFRSPGAIARTRRFVRAKTQAIKTLEPGIQQGLAQAASQPDPMQLLRGVERRQMRQRPELFQQRLAQPAAEPAPGQSPFGLGRPGLVPLAAPPDPGQALRDIAARGPATGMFGETGFLGSLREIGAELAGIPGGLRDAPAAVGRGARDLILGERPEPAIGRPVVAEKPRLPGTGPFGLGVSPERVTGRLVDIDEQGGQAAIRTDEGERVVVPLASVQGRETGLFPALRREVEFFRPVTEPVGRFVGREAAEQIVPGVPRPLRMLGVPDIPGREAVVRGAEAVGGAVAPELLVPSNLIPIPIVDPLVARLLGLGFKLATRTGRAELRTGLRVTVAQAGDVLNRARSLIAGGDRRVPAEFADELAESISRVEAAPAARPSQLLQVPEDLNVVRFEPEVPGATEQVARATIRTDGIEVRVAAPAFDRPGAPQILRLDIERVAGRPGLPDVREAMDVAGRLAAANPERELRLTVTNKKLADLLVRRFGATVRLETPEFSVLNLPREALPSPPAPAAALEAAPAPAARVTAPETPRLATAADDAERSVQQGLPPMRGAEEIGLPSPRVLKTVDEVATDIRRSTQNTFGSLARGAGRIPPLRTIVDFVNPSSLIDRPPAGLVQELGEEGASQLQARLIAHARLLDQGNAMASAIDEGIRQRARAVGFQVEDGLVTSVEGSPPVGDLFENPSRYSLTKPQRELVDEVRVVLDDMNAAEKAAGIKKGEIFSGEGRYFPRLVREVRGTENIRAQVRRIVGAKQGFTRERFYATMQDGIDAGVRYEDDIGAIVGTRIRAGMKASADEGLAQLVRPLGRTLKAPRTTVGIGELGTMVPALGGRAFKPDTARVVMDALNPAPPGSTLRFLDSLNSLLRPIQATGELSFWGIQMLTGLFRNPAAFTKGALYSLDGLLLDGRLYGRYVQRNAPWLERFIGANGVWNSSEFTFDQAVRNRTIKSLFEKVGLKGALGRFDQAFNQALNVTGLENFKGMVGVGDSVGFDHFNRTMRAALGDLAGETTDEVAASIASKMTGRLPVRALGVKATQRSVESSLAFAPRYYRAMFGLLGDAVQGGMRGAEARRILGSLFGGAVVLHVGAARALGQEPNLDPRNSDFLTVTIGGVKVGVGGPIYGLGRMLAESVQNPDKLAGMSMNNPLVRWARGRTAPVLSLLTDLVTQKTFLGKPIDSAGDLLRELATTPIPFIAQQALEEGPGGVPPQFFGLRAFPESAFDQFKQAFKEETGVDYDGREQHRTIARQNPRLAQMLEQSEEEAQARGFEPAVARQEREQAIAGLAEDVRPFVEGVRAGNPDAAPAFVRAYSDFKTQRAGVFQRDFFGEDFPEPESGEGRALDELGGMNPNAAPYLDADPETGSFQVDWELWYGDRDRLLDIVDRKFPGFKEQYLTRPFLPEEFRDVEERAIGAAQLRDQLRDIPKYTAFPLSLQTKLEDFRRDMLRAREERKNVVGSENVESVAEFMRIVGPVRGLSEDFIEAAINLGSSRWRAENLNTEYEDFIISNRDALLLFYPDLRSDRIGDLILAVEQASQ